MAPTAYLELQAAALDGLAFILEDDIVPRLEADAAVFEGEPTNRHSRSRTDVGVALLDH